MLEDWRRYLEVRHSHVCVVVVLSCPLRRQSIGLDRMETASVCALGVLGSAVSAYLDWLQVCVSPSVIVGAIAVLAM